MATTGINLSPLPTMMPLASTYDEPVQVQRTAPIDGSSNAIHASDQGNAGNSADMQSGATATLADEMSSTMEGANQAMAASSEDDRLYVGTQVSVYA